MRNVARACLAVFACLVIPACDGNESAIAKCGSAQAYSSNLGVLNVPQLRIGTVFVVDTKSMSATLVGHAVPKPDDLSRQPDVDLDGKLDSKLQITFSANVPQAAKVSLESVISNGTKITVKKLAREDFMHVLDRVNEISNLATTYKAMPQPADGKLIPFVVHAIGYAESSSLTLSGATTNTANVSVIKFGDFSLTVNYSCNEMLNLNAQPGQKANMFFKATPLGCDASNKFYIDPSPEIDLSEVRLSLLVR